MTEGVIVVKSCINILNLPLQSTEHGIREIVILEFSYNVTPEDAINEAIKHDLDFPSYDNASCFALEYPDQQREPRAVFIHYRGYPDIYDLPYTICLGHSGDQMSHISLFAYDQFRASRFAFTRNKYSDISLIHNKCSGIPSKEFRPLRW